MFDYFGEGLIGGCAEILCLIRRKRLVLFVARQCNTKHSVVMATSAWKHQNQMLNTVLKLKSDNSSGDKNADGILLECCTANNYKIR